MSSGTLQMRICDLESKITYPPPKKKVLWQEPHRSAESKRLLAEYKALVAAEALERQKYAIASGSGVAAARASSSHAGRSEGKSHASLSGLVGGKLTPDPMALIAVASQADNEGRPDDAVGCLLEALRLCHTSGQEHSTLAAEINERLGMHHIDKEMYSDAIAYFTAGVTADPIFSRNYLHRAECYILLDNPLKAFEEYEKYFKLEHPTKSQLVRCGKSALDADLLDRAEVYLKRTLETSAVGGADGGDVAAADQSSSARMLEGGQAVSAAANDAYAYYSLGELEEKRHRDIEARQYFAKVIATDPEFHIPYEAQANEEFDAGNFTMALHLFESLAKILPNEAKFFIRLADVYENLGEEFASSVLQCLSKALELRQERNAKEQTLVRRGRLYFFSFQQIDDAIGDLTSCLALNPENHEALNLRALAYRSRAASAEDAAAAVKDYLVLAALPHVGFDIKAEPHLFLANDAFSSGDLAAAARYFSLAALFDLKRFSREDTMRMRIAIAHVTVQAGDGFDETYEGRGWPVRDGGDKGKKADANAAKGPSIPSLGYTTVDSWYLAIKEREPTVHTELEYAFIALWKPFREDVDRRREEADAIRSGKKPAKKK